MEPCAYCTIRKAETLDDISTPICGKCLLAAHYDEYIDRLIDERRDRETLE